MNERVHLVITGRVQGVWYRASAQQAGQERGLTGWVRNLPDGAVEAVAEGPREKLQDFISWCHEGPPAARVDHIDVEWLPATGEFGTFDVRH